MASYLRLFGRSHSLISRERFGLAGRNTADMSELPLSAREALSGIPAEHLSRPVVIYMVALTAMQSGGGKRRWRLDFADPGLKWRNPMMGWTSSRDPLTQLRMDFPSEEEAVTYAKNLGLQYTIKSDNLPFHDQTFDDQLYDTNFLFKGTGEDPTDNIFDDTK